MKKIIAILLMGLWLFSLTGCAASAAPKDEMISNSAAGYDSGYAEEGYYDTVTEEVEVEFEEETPAMAGGSTVEPEMPDDGRKIIRNTTMTVETKAFDESVVALKQAIGAVSGYVEYSSQYSGGRTRSAEYVCRIPADRYSKFLESVSGTGSVVRTEESTEDATAQYVDMESRLRSLRTQEERLLELMEESGSLEELLAVQDKLMEVQYQIESYTGQMKVLTNRIDYATVQIYLEEVEVYTPVEPSFGEEIVDTFSEMLRDVKNGAEDILLAVIYLIPLWIIAAAAAAVIVLLVKRSKRKKAKKLQEYYAAQSVNENTPKE